jgi:nitrate reductase molybdenum cofactor assembly chaperone NarJ/NarW
VTTARVGRSWQVQSLLLGYPDAAFAARLPLVHQAVSTLPEPVAAPLRRFLDHVDGTSFTDLAVDYVDTFDNRKRCCLFLTYYQHGDTRNRGVALLKLKQTYKRGAMTLVDDELPDHLAVLLEFVASGDVEFGRALLGEHRVGLELLRFALTDAGSPWRWVLESVSATLPALKGEEHAAVARLAADGPPEEQVGLAPFAPPEYMPQPTGGPR